MGKYFGLFLVVVFFSIPYAFPQENITITTYYPSPVGVYNELLVSNRMAVGDINGDGVVNGLDLPTDAAGNPLPNSFQTVNSLTDRQAVGDVDGNGHINGGDLAHDANGNPINGALTVANSLGIGTVTPQGELHIRSTDNANGNANIILEGENPANGASTGAWDINSQGGTPGTPPAGNLQFTSTAVDANGNPIVPPTTPMTIEQGAPNNSLYIADNGNVGIGTNNPQSRLDVNGGIRVGNDPVCNASKAGTLGYNSGQMQFCDGNGWKAVGGTMQTVATIKRYENPAKPLSVQSYIGANPGDVNNVAEKVTAAHGPDAWSSHALFGVRCKSENGWILTGASRAAAGVDNDSFFYDNAAWGDNQDSSQNQNVLYAICVKMQ